MLETELANLLLGHLEKRYQGWSYYPERAVVVSGQTYSVDFCWVRAVPGGRGVIHAWQVKERLTPHLVEQCRLLCGLADETWAAVREPESQSGPHQSRRLALGGLGVGLVYIAPDAVTFPLEPLAAVRGSDRLLETCVPGWTAPAGSAAGKRIAADQWEPVRALLRATPGMGAKEIGTAMKWSPVERTKFTSAVFNGRIRGLRGTREGYPMRIYCDE